MARKYVRVVFAVAASAGVVLLTAGGSTTAQEKKALTIGEIMRAGHGKTDPLLGKVAASAKGGKWEDATTAAKSLDENAALLAKATPRKGDAASWEKLSKKYHDNTAALLTATEKKDAAAAKASVGALQGLCMECHSIHKGGKGK